MNEKILEYLETLKDIVSELENELKKERGMEREAYSISEVARLTGLCTQTVWRYIHQNKIQARRVGRKHLIPASELKKILK